MKMFTLTDVLVALVIGLILGIVGGGLFIHHCWKQTVIAHHAAHYQITNEITGESAWYWNDTGKRLDE